MTNKVEFKIQQIARYRVTGMKDAEICKLMNLSGPGLARIVALPEYKDVEQEILKNHLASMDNALEKRVEAIKTELRAAVPHAVAAMVDIVKQRRDLRASLSAAADILDRDPDHALSKQSRATASLEANSPRIPVDTLASLTREADALTKVNFIHAQPKAEAEENKNAPN